MAGKSLHALLMAFAVTFRTLQIKDSGTGDAWPGAHEEDMRKLGAL